MKKIILDISKITTQEEARQFAIEWQQWVSERGDLSYQELADWQEAMEEMAEEFNLMEELRENGIL